MKSYTLLLVVFAAIIASSCSNQTPATLYPELQQVENLMYAYPDSALRMLEQMPMPNPDNQLNHATWCLFLAQAKYKNYVVQPSDSLVQIAHTYFMTQTNPQRKALVLYMEGVIFEERDDTEKALQFYLEAADEIQKSTDYQLGHLIYVGVGRIYAMSRLYDYAKEALEKSYDYAKLSGSEQYVMNASMLFGRLFVKLKDWDSAIRYYEEAMNISESMGDDRESGRIMLEMSEIYYNKNDYLKALEYTQKEFELMDEAHPDYANACLIVGISYYYIDQLDSASFYLNKVLESESMYNKRVACEVLYYLSYEKKEYEKMTGYFNTLQTYTDSIQKIDRAEAVVEIQEKYNKEKLLNEKNQLRIEKDQTVRVGLLILVLLLCIIMIIIYSYQYRLLQKERTIQKNEEQLRRYTMKVHENESLINRNASRIRELSIAMEQNKETQELLEEQRYAIAEMQSRNEALHYENETLRENIRHYSSLPQEESVEFEMLNVLTEENLRLQDRERFLENQLLKKTQVLNALKVSPKYLNSAYWEEAIEAINWLYENYTNRLTKELPSLTEKDIQMCCLIKLHLAVPEIATLLGISPTSVSKYKFRLKERIIHGLGEPLGENKSLDLWLWEY